MASPGGLAGCAADALALHLASCGRFGGSAWVAAVSVLMLTGSVDSTGGGPRRRGAVHR